MKNDGLKDIVHKHVDKSKDRSRGGGTRLAEILIDLALDEELPPPTYKEQVEAHLHGALSDDLRKTHSSMNRSVYGILPQMSQYGMSPCIANHESLRNKGSILVAVDVSGSMGNDDVRQAIKETLNLLDSLGPGHKIMLTQVDTVIADWVEFETGSPEFLAFLAEIEEKDFIRKSCGGTEYQSLFKLVKEIQAGIPTEYSAFCPKQFHGADYGVPEEIDVPDVMMIFTDWGFDPRSLDLIDEDKTALFWVGVTSRNKGMTMEQGTIIDCEELSVQNKEQERGI